MIRILIILSLFLFPGVISSQVSSDTVKTYSGERICLPIKFQSLNDSADNHFFSAKMVLKNPSLFFPVEFEQSQLLDIQSQDITKISDSVYIVSVRFKCSYNADSDTLFLCGESLSGYDSTCVISFEDVELNNTQQKKFIGVIVVRYKDVQRSYIRFAVLEQNYPNPVLRGTETNWIYLIDKRSEVKFYIYTPTGKKFLIENLGMKEPGIYNFKYIPNPDLATGMYWMMISTNTGDDIKNFIVIN